MQGEHHGLDSTARASGFCLVGWFLKFSVFDACSQGCMSRQCCQERQQGPGLRAQQDRCCLVSVSPLQSRSLHSSLPLCPPHLPHLPSAAESGLGGLPSITLPLRAAWISSFPMLCGKGPLAMETPPASRRCFRVPVCVNIMSVLAFVGWPRYPTWGPSVRSDPR